MMRIRLGTALVAFAALLFGWAFTPPVAYACSCVGPISPEEQFERSEAAFAGTAVSVEEKRVGSIAKSVTIDVTETWKGVTDSRVVVTTGGGGGDCGFDFREGERYLVYASRSSMYGDASDLVTTMCDRTALWTAAGNDLNFLGKGGAPATKGGLEEEDPGEREAGPGGGARIVFWGVGIVCAGIFLYYVWNLRKSGKRRGSVFPD